MLVFAAAKSLRRVRFPKAFFSTASESASVESVEEDDLFSNLPEDARRIAEFTGIGPDEYEDIRDFDYYVRYIESMYAIPHWKAVGTAELILGVEPSITQEKVVNYLNGRAPRGFAFLFEAFFLEKYSTDDIIEYAKSYAYYLTKATLENHSYSEFMTEDYRVEWFKKVGCTREYDYDEYDRMIENGEHSRVAGITMVHTGKHKWIYGGESWVENAADLYDMIHQSLAGFDEDEELIRADAPRFFEAHAKDSYAIVELYDSEDGVSFTLQTNDSGANIKLSFADSSYHEYVHALTVRGGGTDFRWLCEGIAEYYSVRNSNRSRIVSKESIDLIAGNISVEEYWEMLNLNEKEALKGVGEIQKAVDSCREVYLAYKEKYGDAYSDALYAYAAVAEKEIETGEVVLNYSVSGVYDIASNGGRGKHKLVDDLSYMGACILYREMIKDYGAEKVLAFLYAGGDFKTEFGMTSEEYYEKVRERGGYKLGFFDDTPYSND